ncbi:hypothetical protein NJB1907f44_19400 [Mycobacterium marinum]|uniref:Uncharacterized protein n=3 Tax=Mycobacterium ulcerans group TaxID=2993898 RepID=A0A7I7L6K8_9MYCO|nr:hypothetical protein [Mycobacterium shottsii]BBC68421.1 hypothetical protein MMRN_53170 [Mycobacterium marinum]BBX55069.1 hypothetical protein MSHO_04140 [Mycobacterium shottsii]GJN99398.1 hypothetical protein NJB1907f34b_12780 [Mycobacterium marinum]GJO05701.1 hypothetical protein NJB1907E90_16000 [Mycobacterium marinum]GJO06282.1 hypothetical protein NJB1808e29_35260 [Mycobacterium marinum]
MPDPYWHEVDQKVVIATKKLDGSAGKTPRIFRVALPEASEALDSTLRDLKARIAALEASRTSYEEIVDAIKAFGQTQQMLADVLRAYGGDMRGTAEDSNERIRKLEASVAEIKKMLTQG